MEGQHGFFKASFMQKESRIGKAEKLHAGRAVGAFLFAQ